VYSRQVSTDSRQVSTERDTLVQTYRQRQVSTDRDKSVETETSQYRQRHVSTDSRQVSRDRDKSVQTETCLQTETRMWCTECDACLSTSVPCIQVDVMDVDLNLVIEVDLHLLTVIVIQLGVVPPLYVHVLTCPLSVLACLSTDLSAVCTNLSTVCTDLSLSVLTRLCLH